MTPTVKITSVQQGFYRAIIEREDRSTIVPIVNRSNHWLASFDSTQLDVTHILHQADLLDETLIAFTESQ
jgi:hypothetical protein